MSSDPIAGKARPMNRRAALSMFSALSLGMLVAACADVQSGAPVTPAARGLTFLYFYTDG